MSDEIFAPPTADTDVVESNEQTFYVVSPTKFLLLSILTISLYNIYWFYRNWREVKARDKLGIWPPMRGLFYIFFTHSLFRRVDAELESVGASRDWSSGAIATLVVVMAIVSAVLDRLTRVSIGEPYTDILSIFMVPIIAFLLLQAQKAINLACGDPEGHSNSSLTAANWIWMILGGAFWLLVLIGMYFLVVDPAWLNE
ncbi:MAG: hypothetical protein AAF545_10155 [Pseudomonadota bacterium]